MKIIRFWYGDKSYYGIFSIQEVYYDTPMAVVAKLKCFLGKTVKKKKGVDHLAFVAAMDPLD